MVTITICGMLMWNPLAAEMAEKAMTGDPLPKDLSEPFRFDFVLTAQDVVKDGSFVGTDLSKPVVAGDNWTKSVFVDPNNTTPSVDFDTFTYTKPGTYVYKIVESKSESSVITFDSTEWTYTVVVTDDHEGALVAEWTYATADTTGKSAAFTNSYSRGVVKVDGKKNWQDNNDADGVRPKQITIRLYADGTEVDHVTVTEKDDWKYSFESLPKYNKDNKEIEYTIGEDAVDGYTTNVNGYNVTNKRNTVPKTGDGIELLPLIAMELASALLCVFAVFAIRRRRNSDDS